MVLFQEVANLECADSECLETRNWESRIGDYPALPYCIESVIKVEEFKQGGEDKVTRTMCFVWLGWAICATAWLLLELILVQQNEFVKSFEGIAEFPGFC